jgi:hypothetical protein
LMRMQRSRSGSKPVSGAQPSTPRPLFELGACGDDGELYAILRHPASHTRTKSRAPAIVRLVEQLERYPISEKIVASCRWVTPSISTAR